MDADRELTQLFSRQHGLATRHQLYALGVSRGALRWRLGRTWTAVVGPVVADAMGPLDDRQRRVAGQLLAGPDAVLTGDHAVLHHGLRSGRGNRPVRVLVPMNQDARTAGFVRVHRTRRIDPSPVRDGPLRVARLPRAVLDAARWATDLAHARSVVIEAVQSRRVTVDALQHELEAGPRRGRSLARQAVDDARAGAWSVPEADLLHLVASSTVLPHVEANPILRVGEVRLISPDGWIDDVALALMVHSRAHHARDADWEGTVEADGALTEHGIVVLAFTPRSIATDPRAVLDRVERTYLELSRSGRRRPPVVMTPRSPGLS